jgi:Protein of unknown function (DUF725)
LWRHETLATLFDKRVTSCNLFDEHFIDKVLPIKSLASIDCSSVLVQFPALVLTMKAIFLICVILATHCSTTVVEEQQIAIENQRFIDIFGGLSSLISQLIESIKQALRDLVNQTGKWIQNEISTIEKAIADGFNAFNQYIKNVQELLNGVIKPCIEEVPEKIKKVKNETITEVQKCQQTGLAKLMALQNDVLEYQKVNQAAVGASYAHIQACFSAPNFGDKVICAVNAARNVSDTVEVLRQNIVNTSATISAKVKAAALETHECVSNKLKEGQQKIEGILNEARECLAQTTTTPPEVTTTIDGSSEGSGADHDTNEFIFLW